jgi:3-deoxy-D-manno-octulosonate 8-phosphate phosphatase (KDO 8-P phosphatase)
MPKIRAFLLDVDGVLTDDTFWWGPNGEEWKRFSFADVMGISRARRGGYLFALVSGEDSPLIDRFAAKVGIEQTFKNCKDKASALRAYARKNNLELSEIAFMGNDVNDVEAMEIAGLAAAPADAQPDIRSRAAIVTERPSGRGAVRELLNSLAPEAFAPAR